MEKANEEEYSKAFRTALDSRKGMMVGVMHQARPTAEELDEAAIAIQEAHHEAMKKTIPTARICRHTVPYWDDKLSTLHNKRM